MEGGFPSSAPLDPELLEALTQMAIRVKRFTRMFLAKYSSVSLRLMAE
jgi:hypothetical protein